jgi:hypothetical protein
VAALVGVVFYAYCRIKDPAYFRNETLTSATHALVSDD